MKPTVRRRLLRGQVPRAVKWLVLIAVAVAAALLIRVFVLQSYSIPSPSMEPTLRVGDRVYVNKLAYDFHAVRRGDVVVFRTPPGYTAAPRVPDLIKRVIGLPGETVGAVDGSVYIDGHPLKEKWLPKGTSTANFGPVIVPKHSYFVMGDNRADSSDSRLFGPIPAGLIVGRAFVVLWPISRVRRI